MKVAFIRKWTTFIKTIVVYYNDSPVIEWWYTGESCSALRWYDTTGDTTMMIHRWYNGDTLVNHAVLCGDMILLVILYNDDWPVIHAMVIRRWIMQCFGDMILPVIQQWWFTGDFKLEMGSILYDVSHCTNETLVKYNRTPSHNFHFPKAQTHSYSPGSKLTAKITFAN